MVVTWLDALFGNAATMRQYSREWPGGKDRRSLEDRYAEGKERGKK